MVLLATIPQHRPIRQPTEGKGTESSSIAENILQIRKNNPSEKGTLKNTNLKIYLHSIMNKKK